MLANINIQDITDLLRDLAIYAVIATSLFQFFYGIKKSQENGPKIQQKQKELISEIQHLREELIRLQENFKTLQHEYEKHERDCKDYRKEIRGELKGIDK